MSLDSIVLGRRIREAREQLGMSQEDLAMKIGRDQRAVSEYENGKRRISVTELPTFAQVLQVPVMYFFEGDNVMDDFDMRVLAEFHRLLEPEDKSLAIDLLRIFCNGVTRKD